MSLHRLFAGFANGILALMCLVSSACTTARTVEFSKIVPDFDLNDSEGKPIRLSNYKGRVVLLNFWATWCHGCVLEIPWFIEFQERYKDSGLSVIGISMDEGWKPVKTFAAGKNVNYPFAIDNKGLAKLYVLKAMPMTLLIDRSGEIAASYVGVVDKAACESKIQTLLRQETQKTPQ